MTDQKKTKAELIAELQEARLDNFRLKTLLKRNSSGIIQNEDDLNEPHKLLQDVQKLAKIGLWEWDKATDNVTWSDELYKIAGLDSNLPAPSFAEHAKLYTPHSWNILQSAVEKAINTGESYQFDLEMIRPDGTIRNVRVIGGARFNTAQNIITGLYGLVRDETECKQAQEALLESEKKFGETVNLMPQIIFEIDLKGNITYVNKNALKIFGYPEDYVIEGKSSFDFYTPESRLRVIENMSQRIAGNLGLENSEYLMVRKDGSTFPVLVYSSPILKHGIPIGLRGIIVDITEHKQSEEVIRLSEEKFRKAFQNS